LGGALIAASGWRAIFFVNLPLGLLALALVLRHLPPDRPRASPPAFDKLGALLLALTLGAYALAMTSGRGLWLAVAALGAILFVRAERRAVAPLLRLSMFADRLLGAGFAMSALVSTVVMATLVVGPFYLSGALALDAAQVGLVMSSGPIVAALTGVPAGRWVDRWGAHRVTRAGLLAMAGGTALLPWMPLAWGVAGYIAPLLVVTAGYASFQAANNTPVMVSQPADRRGLVSGLLSLSRNLGLITGASVMGSLYALGSDATAGLRLSFGVATLLVGVAIVVALAVRPRPESAP
jgi:MFS family permease